MDPNINYYLMRLINGKLQHSILNDSKLEISNHLLTKLSTSSTPYIFFNCF